MIYIFNDLLFDNEEVILQQEDIKNIFKDSQKNITFFENTDGLIFAANEYTQKEI